MAVNDNKRKRLQELKALRSKGRTRLDTYEIEEDVAIYDELDNDEFRKHQQERLREDDFVVDDNGQGYMDTGAYEWENGTHNYYSDEEEDRMVKKKKKKVSAEDSQTKKDADVTAMFRKVSAIQTKPQQKSTREDDDFFDQLLGDLDTSEAPKATYTQPMKKTVSRIKPSFSMPLERTPTARNERVPSSPPMKALASSPSPPDDFAVSPPRDSTPATQDVSMEDDSNDDEELTLRSLRPAVNTAPVNIASVKAEEIKVTATETPSSDITPEDLEDLPDVSISDLGQIEIAVSEKNVVEAAPLNAVASDVKSFFWTDYYETSEELLLFGKAKLQENGKSPQYVTCSIIIRGLCREMYFLPRKTKLSSPDQEVGIQDIYDEVTVWVEKQAKINKKLNNFRVKAVDRKYCFDLQDVPRESQYLKLLLPFTQMTPPPLSGETFSRVFGTRTAMFEQFVLCRKIKGPCWLDLTEAVVRNTKSTKCALELEITDPFHITPSREQSSAPPLTIMSFSIRTFMNEKSNRQEVVAISASVYKNTHVDPVDNETHPKIEVFTIVRPSGKDFSPQMKVALRKQKEIKNGLQGTVILKQREDEVVQEFLDKIAKTDPDIFLGHRLENIHLPIVMHAAKEHKSIHRWDNFGRLKRSSWPKIDNLFLMKQLTCGRLLCDLYNTMGQSLTTACDTWSLSEMCEKYLDNLQRPEWDIDISKYDHRDDPEKLIRFLKHNENDTYYAMRIALATQILPLTKQLTEIAGNSWAGTLSGSRSQRNEFILLHEFTREKYIVPDKRQRQMAQKEQHDEIDMNPSKSKYQGGKVLDPQTGLYRTIVLVLDFNSLYPSIIREFNICFTTIDYTKYNDEEGVDSLTVPDNTVKQGIFPRLIENLVETRKYVKSEMKKVSDIKLKKRFDIKQQALKLTANSMYGCLGFENSRFYALPLAVLITHRGRDILTNTCGLAEKNQLQVVYGDTDSVMINTNVYWDKLTAESKCAELMASTAKWDLGTSLSSDQKLEIVQKLAKEKELKIAYDKAVQIGNQFKKIVNEQYKSLELDIDNVFKTLLLNAKKKYAAVDLTDKPYAVVPSKNKAADELVSRAVKTFDIRAKLIEQQIIKGLDLVRREYCQLSKQVSHYALNQILSDESVEDAVENIHDYLRKMSEEVRNGKSKLHLFLIRKKLNKSPDQYQGASRDQPQVQVAFRRRAEGDMIGKDDVVSYIITTGKEKDLSGSPASRAYMLDECKKYDLKPDVDWYLQTQILQPLERICHNIEGIDKGSIGQCLGIKVHQSIVAAPKDTYVPLEYTISNEIKFSKAAPLKIKCKCGHCFEFKGLNKFASEIVGNEGITCPKCKETISQTRVNAQLECSIRHEIAKYYNGWLKCSECGVETRKISVYGRRCPRRDETSCTGAMTYRYTSKMMHYQLQYYSWLFNVDEAKKNAGKPISDAEMALNKDVTILQETQIITRAELNRQRFSKAQGVVYKYISDCGRAFVDMREIFGSA